MLALRHCSENGTRKKRRLVFAHSPEFWKQCCGVFVLAAALLLRLIFWNAVGIYRCKSLQCIAAEFSAAGSSRYTGPLASKFSLLLLRRPKKATQ